MTSPFFLKLDAVSAAYGARSVLHDISFSIAPGETVAVLGANGAGKSTLIKTISGIHLPSSGAITYRAERCEELPAHERVARGIIHVPEGRCIFGKMTVYENLQLGAYLREDRAETARDLDRVTTLFPILHERRAQKGVTLSGGEQQMLAIARALMARPTLLLLDEPSMGVAPVFVEKIFSILSTLRSEGITMIIVEQEAHAVLHLAERAIVLETGRITIQDSAEALLRDSRIRDAYLAGSA
jgi:branched-chain amino acid transport system ATP-binding protein